MVIMFMILIKKDKKENNDIELLKIHLNTDISEKRLILDNLVQDALNDYVIFNLGTVDEPYITEDVQQDMLKYIVKNVLLHMTPAIMDNIAIGYPADDIDKLANSIQERAHYFVLQFSIEQNSKDYDEKDVPNITDIE